MRFAPPTRSASPRTPTAPTSTRDAWRPGPRSSPSRSSRAATTTSTARIAWGRHSPPASSGASPTTPPPTPPPPPPPPPCPSPNASTRSSRARSTPPSRPCPRARGARRANTTAGASPGRSGAAAGLRRVRHRVREGGCVPRPDAACGCPFHRRADERWMEKVKRRARETEGYADRFQRAAAAYAAQAEGALVGVEVVDPDDPEDHPDPRGPGPASSRGRLPPPGEKFEWRRRPDAAKFCRVLRDLCDIPTRRAREKLLPLLLHWDLRAGAEVPRDASEGERFRRLRALGVEFVASRVRKPQRNRGFAPWRYLIDVNAADPSESAAFRAARESEREERKRGKKPPPGVSESEDDRSDEAAEEDARDAGKTEVVRDLEVFAKRTAYRAVRLGLVRETCAGLVAAMKAGEREASGTTRDGERRQSTLFGAPAGVPATPARRKATPRRRATPDPAQTSIRGFFTPTGPRRRELFPAGPEGDAKTPEAAPRPGANGDDDDDDDDDSSPRASPPLSAGSDGSAEIARAGLRPVTVVHRDREYRAGAGGPGAGVAEPPPPPPPDVVELLTPSPDVAELLTPPTPGEEGKHGVARGGGGGRPRATPRGISDEGVPPRGGGRGGGIAEGARAGSRGVRVPGDAPLTREEGEGGVRGGGVRDPDEGAGDSGRRRGGRGSRELVRRRRRRRRRGVTRGFGTDGGGGSGSCASRVVDWMFVYWIEGCSDVPGVPTRRRLVRSRRVPRASRRGPRPRVVVVGSLAFTRLGAPRVPSPRPPRP